MYRPLADELRPKNFDEVCGQNHILGENAVLRRIIQSGNIPNLIFYGPSGTGKTTVANIIAEMTNRTLRKLNATTASTADIKSIVSELDTLMAPNGILLYLDEIQYFNKRQQQSLLEYIENGKITLIASTTENPYFYVYNAVLSRSSIFEFKPLTPKDAVSAIKRAISYLEDRNGITVEIENGVLDTIAHACGGDMRKALNMVELLFSSAYISNQTAILKLEDIRQVIGKTAARYDKNGDDHFDIASAFMKSLRGSDPNAALHYLARLLESGDMITAMRRLLCSASEDIGLAYPQAASIVKSCVDSAMQLGLPEARLPLAEATILLATAPKSNSVVTAIDAAMSDVQKGNTGAYPRHLQNVHADSFGMEREQGYLYPHNFPGHWVNQQYLPDEIKNKQYYKFGDNKIEKLSEQYWESIKKGQ